MSYRIIAFIIAAGLVAFFLATGTDSVHADSTLPMDELTDSTIMAAPYFARTAFSHQCLKVERDGKIIDLPENKELIPGDIVETCSRHFALIEFYPAGTMILYPASRATIVSDGSELLLKSAELLFESDLSESSFPDVVRCFDETLYHIHDAPSVSFGVHCRGESGMILTSKTGSLWWTCRDVPCEIPAGQGLMGRITTANYSEVTLPAQPHITTVYVIPQRQAKDPLPDSDPEADAEINSDDKSGFSATIMWNRVEMADQYLVHIYQDTEERIHHVLTLHHKNRFAAELPGPGRYIARIMAVDFYGVSGKWSAPFSFTADHDEFVGEDSLDALSPGNTVQSENTVPNPDSDSLLPDNGDRHL